MRVLRSTSPTAVLLALAIFILPFVVSNQLFSGSINAKYFYITLVFTLFFLFVAYLFVSGKHTLSLRGRWLLGALGLVLALHYVSTVVGVFPAGSFFSDILRSTGVLFLTYIAVCAWLLSEVFGEQDWIFVRRALATSATLYGLLTFFSPQGLALTGRFLSIDFTTNALTIGNTTFGGAFLTLGLIVTLIEFVRAESKKTRIVFGVCALVQLISPLLLSFGLWSGDVSLTSPLSLLGEARASSAAAWGLLVFLAGLWAIRRYLHLPQVPQKRVLTIYSVLWLIVILVTIGLLFVPGSTVQEEYIETATAARILVWEDSFAAIVERPVFGWGSENFRLAHDGYIDTRLYLGENIGETWFDRAHNIIIGTLISVGVFGAMALLLFGAYFLFVVRRAYREELIGYGEASILAAFPVVHFLQLQTSFDTITTYLLLAVLVGYVLWLERRLAHKVALTPVFQRTIAGVLLVLTLAGAWYMLGEYKRQRALFKIFISRNQAEQVALIDTALSGSASFEALRLSSSSFLKGLLEGLRTTDEEGRQRLIASGLAQMDVYERHYQTYLARVPEDYRLRMNYAYLLLMRTVLGDDRVAEAKSVIADSYELSPGNPLTYVMDALAHLYGGDLETAREKVNEALALNPQVPLSLGVAQYIEQQAAQFPQISVINLENL